MGNLGIGEILLIFLVLLLLFGGKKLPQLAEGMGKALKNFRKAVQEPDEDEKTEDKETK
ncbi:MAG: twin-arginine translocase TatA/TatE family subunit [Acidobacteria bacterium]|nr:MAG: twin-arginine translocase TatA/TatE family subunit [Acidobacteriota bacterium]RLE23135.1 MAG: twin-arginine translocase TatA/TatE family subunit [Acidobacteriota bacterium]